MKPLEAWRPTIIEKDLESREINSVWHTNMHVQLLVRVECKGDTEQFDYRSDKSGNIGRNVSDVIEGELGESWGMINRQRKKHWWVSKERGQLRVKLYKTQSREAQLDVGQ